MKRESLGWFVAGAVIVLTCTLGAMQQQGSVGRFQLVDGTYEIIGEKGKVACPTVWRIDTVTGEAVQYLASIDENGKHKAGWTPVTLNYGD
jgi:hypothetical protein